MLIQCNRCKKQSIEAVPNSYLCHKCFNHLKLQNNVRKSRKRCIPKDMLITYRDFMEGVNDFTYTKLDEITI